MLDDTLRRLRGSARPLTQKQLSQTISFARISLVVGLVFLHYGTYPNSKVSPFHGVDVGSHQVATAINSFILFCFFSVVPLLSLISGWLFFAFDPNDAAKALRQRIGRRFTSLYMPLVFWNGLFLAALFELHRLAPSHPLLAEINVDFSIAGLRQYVNAVFGITKHPIGFQFWFVRDLFVTALVSPILWLALKRAPLVGALVLGLSWLAGFNLWIFFRADVAFFFFLGGLARTRRVDLQIGRRATTALGIAYLVLMVLRTLAPYVTDGAGPTTLYVLEIATRASRVIGALACWGVFQRVALTSFGGRVARFGSFAFFLHAVHYPFLGEAKIVLWRFLPAETDAWMLAHYAASVVVTVAFGVGAGYALARWWPAAFALMNGGREPSATRPSDGEASPEPSLAPRLTDRAPA
jgi:surface polysaccharide O-acyltransferase-like enzyme